MRRPDGTFVTEDPRAVARRIEACSPGWLVWWGHLNNHYFAMPRSGPVVDLIEAATVEELLQWMGWTTAARTAWRR